MRLDCETEIEYRNLHPNNSGRHKKAFLTTLTLYRSPQDKKSSVFLLLGTTKNPAWRKYRVDGNIEALFTTFVREGKASIRMREPKHNVIISKAESTELHSFFSLLRRVQLGEKLDQHLFSEPPSKVTRARKSLTVSDEHQYPPEGFPSTLTSLTIEGCNLFQVRSDILALANLCVLNLKDNKIQTLPPQLSNLPLKVLAVSKNCIVQLHPDIFEGRLRGTLECLDVSRNQLTFLPDTLCSARKLVSLAVGHNRLHELPDCIGGLCALQTLDLTANALTFLPTSLLNRKLDFLSLHDNPLSTNVRKPLEYSDASWQVPWTLLELAARAVVDGGHMKLTAEDVPRSLLQLLHTATPCFSCQRPVFPATATRVHFRVNPRMVIGHSGQLCWVPSHDFQVPVRALVCSNRCFPQHRCSTKRAPPQ